MELNQSGKMGTWIVAAILLTITVLSSFSKELWVAPSGQFIIFGHVGLLLVIGLLRRWKYIRKIVSILTLLVIVSFLMGIIMVKSISMSGVFLLIGLSISFYLTTFSKAVNGYLEPLEE